MTVTTSQPTSPTLTVTQTVLQPTTATSTVTLTATAPASTVTTPAATVTVTTGNPGAAAAAGAAAASSGEEDTTDSGWVAFAILAFGACVGDRLVVARQASGRDAAGGVGRFIPVVRGCRTGGAGGCPMGRLDRLTTREREVLALIAKAETNAAISADLGITTRAVERHVNSIFRKLEIPNLTAS